MPYYLGKDGETGWRDSEIHILGSKSKKEARLRAAEAQTERIVRELLGRFDPNDMFSASTKEAVKLGPPNSESSKPVTKPGADVSDSDFADLVLSVLSRKKPPITLNAVCVAVAKIDKRHGFGHRTVFRRALYHFDTTKAAGVTIEALGLWAQDNRSPRG